MILVRNASYAPHDMATLVKLMGGDKRYLDRLDYLWDHHYGDVGDEVGFVRPSLCALKWGPLSPLQTDWLIFDLSKYLLRATVTDVSVLVRKRRLSANRKSC